MRMCVRTLVLTLCLALIGAWTAGVAAAGWTPLLEDPQPDAFYAQQLATAGLKVIHRQDVDLTGDGQPETLLLAVGVGCGGCHEKRLVIFSGARPLAELTLNDPVLEPHPGVGVWITQPTRLPDEPLCCPSGSYTVQLLWNPGSSEAGRFVLGSPVVVQPGILHPKAPLHSVATYYELLGAGLFEQAYDLLSGRAQAQAPFASWIEDNRPTGDLLPLALARVPQTSGQVRVEVAEFEPGSTYDMPSARYTGVWQTTPEDEMWRLDSFLTE
jgi:hypothetical protein